MSRENLVNYIKQSKARHKTIEYRLKSGTNVFIKDSLPEHIDISYIFDKIENSIPRKFLHLIDVVYIGEFQQFNDNDTNAMYKDAAIYITNHQDNNEDFIDDFVHELAHAIEEHYGRVIYSDGLIKNEFLAKRATLERSLRHNGYNTEEFDFLTAEYSKEMDEFFYLEVGYPVMTTMTMNMFMSPYAATSLREYFANGLEHYYLSDRVFLKNISPRLFQKINDLNNIGD